MQNESEGDAKVDGWDEIAKATSKALGRSVQVSTARRWAAPDRQPRLPVFQYGNGRVYMNLAHLALFKTAWTSQVPVGGRPPGFRVTRQGGVRRKGARKRARK